MGYGSVLSLYSEEKGAGDLKDIGSKISRTQQGIYKIKRPAVARKIKGKRAKACGSMREDNKMRKKKNGRIQRYF